jgi:hypothetical protein
MAFLRRFVPGLPGRDDGSDDEGEGEALLEHEDYSSSESESSSTSDQEERMANGGETLQLAYWHIDSGYFRYVYIYQGV